MNLRQLSTGIEVLLRFVVNEPLVKLAAFLMLVLTFKKFARTLRTLLVTFS